MARKAFIIFGLGAGALLSVSESGFAELLHLSLPRLQGGVIAQRSVRARHGGA